MSSSASSSRFSPPSNCVNGHVSTMWFNVCRWPQSQECDWARPHLCRLARHAWALTCTEIVHQRIEYKVALLTFKVRSTSSPNPGSRTRPQPAIDQYDAVSTFHDDNICETRFSMLCTGRVEHTTDKKPSYRRGTARRAVSVKTVLNVVELHLISHALGE